jgi:hypothetical protein
MHDFLNNTLFNETYLASDLPKRFNRDISKEFSQVKELFDNYRVENKSEDDLEDKLISPILRILGFQTETQKSYNIQGETIRPDFSIFHKNDLILLCESKKWEIPLDNKRVKNNPHFQILNYMSKLKLDFSFLTNGRFWRVYDNRKVTFDKKFYEIDLIWLLQNGTIKDFGYFYHIFKSENYLQKEIFEISKESSDFAFKVENDLRSVIYGTNKKSSIFEKIGKAIHRKEKNLDDVFEKSIYFTFRVLFVLFFEDRNRDIVKNHFGYRKLSFNQILQNQQEEFERSDDFSTLYAEFVKLFEVLDKGSPPHKIPLFNGGLFEKDEILDNPQLFGDLELYQIIKNLIYFDETEFKRDFKTLSVINLGSIYEGLLEYRFQVAEDDLYYVEYRENSKSEEINGEYFDTYDYYNLKKDLIEKEEFYKKDEIFLTNSNNSRKESASYYTPETVSNFMVQSAIDRELERKSPLDLRIIDNACGSGHFLVEALNYLAEKSLEKFQSCEIENSEISKIIEKEKGEILENLKSFKIDFIEIPDSQILKRILLKKSIFGVDLNPFAVEITKLALWIDSFIFGTPLSLIEHHVKVGNSLIGTGVADFKRYFEERGTSLFESELVGKFEDLKEVSKEISKIEDTTGEKIEKSKKLFKTSSTKIYELNHYLNFVTTKKIKEIEKDFDFGNDPEIEDILQNRNSKISKEIDLYSKKFNFFNYEVEFAEVFYDEKDGGFDIVIGNPPWEKVKFDEKDFFPKFKRNYRTLSNSKKAEVVKKLLERDDVQFEYKTRKEMFDISNSYLTQNFPLNRGVGDSNLFRFFVEKNLGILKSNASLTYILPSALFQDDGSIKLRTHILENYKLNYFFSFENRLPVFKDVDSRYKFAIIQIENGKSENIKTFFYATDPKDLWNSEKYIDYSVKNIKTIAPFHKNLLEIRSKNDLKIAEKCYSKFENLDFKYFDFRGELHMTADKSIFHETLENGFIPLLEGKTIHQFNPNFSKGKYFLNPSEFDNHLLLKEIGRMISEIYDQIVEKNEKWSKDRVVVKHLLNIDILLFSKEKKVETLKKLAKFIHFDRQFLRVGFRAIARDTDERTVISTIFPKNIGAGNSIYSEIPKRYLLKGNKVEIVENSIEKKLFLVSIFNSVVFDFLARQIVQINVTKSILTRLPIPQPTEKELISDEVYQKLIENSKRVLTFYEDFGFEVVKPKNQKEVDFLKIENDILIAKMYGIEKSELEYILSTFKVFNSKQKSYVETLKSKFS